ncbi:hypothetical protein AB0903_23530 [Streptomyces sp. NPDC048389]|uniref:hypothetical protein n=1 Tax=Streptomyces sp. NPDC048389 TaxID=3154622 RepID=UPI003454E093
MSTTRHLINRQRRLATAASAAERGGGSEAVAPVATVAATDTAAETGGAPPEAGGLRTATAPADGRTGGRRPFAKRLPGRSPGRASAGGTAGGTAAETAVEEAAAEATVEPTAEPTAEDAGDGGGLRAGGRRARLLAVLAVLTFLLGGFAAFAATRAGDLRDTPAARNTALTDIARTSEVKGRVTEAVEAVFSYDFADAGALDLAAEKHLTGRAVEQHDEMLAAVRREGQKQKLVLTTTVTAGGVELLDGDRARVLLYADQSNTRTATKEETTYAAAMLAVDAVHEGGTWRIAGLDTFGAAS